MMLWVKFGMQHSEKYSPLDYISTRYYRNITAIYYLLKFLKTFLIIKTRINDLFHKV